MVSATTISKTEAERIFNESTQMQQGAEDVLERSIHACKELQQILATSFGPTGMNKLVVNALEKLFLTSDAEKIMEEMDVVHPAAKLLFLAAKHQKTEHGDGTNFVVLLCSSLLSNAEDLVKDGISPEKIVDGFKAAHRALLASLETGSGAVSLDDEKAAQRILSTAMQTKQHGGGKELARLVATACSHVFGREGRFNSDNIRTVKVLGGSQSFFVPGMVFTRHPESTIQDAARPKIAVYTCPIDLARTETKGTVLLRNKEDMLAVTASEERLMEEHVKAVADAGVRAIVTGDSINDLMMQYINKYCLLAIRVVSKFELMRICRSTGATALAKFVPPREDQAGFCYEIGTDEVGSTPITVFRQEEAKKSRVATIVLRAATQNVLDDMERAVENGVRTFGSLVKDQQYVYGGGAAEIEMARLVSKEAESVRGVEQYGMKKYAESLEVVAKTLSENSGKNGAVCVADLYAEHSEGKTSRGASTVYDAENTLDCAEHEVLDLLRPKKSAIELSVETAITILRVNQIIMSRPAHGPKPAAQRQQDFQ
ncbi:MAG: T-complex protein 1 subunit theta [Amphiamblys sp. WSBS2006]|nr:MAG: T-complex protein 1 subunit theta [Amphiamblys sp. WSBS2006]